MQQVKLQKKEVYKLLESSETYGTVLHLICFNKYGEEIYKLDSVELYARLQDDFGVLPHDDNESKLMAVITAVSTPYFFTDINVFKSISKTLATGDPGVVDMALEDPTLFEILWGTYEVNLNVESIPFSDNIEKYIDQEVAEEAFEDGMTSDEIMDIHNQSIRDNAIELRLQLQKAGFSDLPKMPTV
jgi:hypothetical protein